MIFHHHALSTAKRFFSTRIQHNASWSSHFHKNLELQYVIRGELECTVNGRTDILREGDFALCLSNEVHEGRSLSDSLLFVCIFSEDCVRSFTSFVEGKEGDEVSVYDLEGKCVTQFTIRNYLRKYSCVEELSYF